MRTTHSSIPSEKKDIWCNVVHKGTPTEAQATKANFKRGRNLKIRKFNKTLSKNQDIFNAKIYSSVDKIAASLFTIRG